MSNQSQDGLCCPVCDTYKFSVPNASCDAELDTMIGSRCLNCGHIVTTDDIADFRELLEEYLQAMLNNDIQ